MTITEFLLERIADDEAAAREVAESQRRDVESSPGDWPEGFDPLSDFYLGGADGPIGYTVIVVGVARVLAECEAKRRIMEEHQSEWGDYGPGCSCCNDTNYNDGARLSSGWPCETMKALAAVYADHPDYDEAWRP